MKPLKKKNQEIKKKELENNLLTPNIGNYLKSAPKQFNVEANNLYKYKDCENSKDVYVAALKEKLQDFAAEGETGSKVQNETEHEVEKELGESDIVSLNLSECTECAKKASEIKEWEAKYKELKKLYVKMSVHSAENELKYNDLLKTKTRSSQLDIDDAVSSSDQVFTTKEVKYLQCMALEKKVDSTFILKCLQYAYKSDMSVLLKKTLRGKPEVIQISEEGYVDYVPAKDPLTPKKVDRIRDLFVERLSKCDVDPADYGERIKDAYMNKLIASGLTNIAKKL